MVPESFLKFAEMLLVRLPAILGRAIDRPIDLRVTQCEDQPIAFVELQAIWIPFQSKMVHHFSGLPLGVSQEGLVLDVQDVLGEEFGPVLHQPFNLAVHEANAFEFGGVRVGILVWIEPIAEHRQGVVEGIPPDENEFGHWVHLVQQAHKPVVLQTLVDDPEALVLIEVFEFFEVSAGHLIQEVGLDASHAVGH